MTRHHRHDPSARSRRALAGVCVTLVAVPFVYRRLTGRWPTPTALRSGDTRAALAGDRGIHVRESIRLERDIGELFRFWRSLDNLPRFMAHLDRVTDLGNGRSRWVARGPARIPVTWDAEIINEVENQVIGWRSLPGSDVITAGSVNFDTVRAGRSTQITLHLQYSAPAGRAWSTVGALFGASPAQSIREDLRRLKQALEAGEIATAGGA